VGDQFHFHPETYEAMVTSEIPLYEWLQTALGDATADVSAEAILDLGAGTGRTAQVVLARHPDAQLHGIDESPAMLASARELLPKAQFTVARLQDPLPRGPFDIVVSCLAVHHLNGPEKADLFKRITAVLRPGGRFVLADVVIPEASGVATVPVDGDDHDKPSTASDQLEWMERAGLAARLLWIHDDLAILAGDRGG
jgi:tRNA (cmo5U34)-methyltransferase